MCSGQRVDYSRSQRLRREPEHRQKRTVVLVHDFVAFAEKPALSLMMD
jgi:hypothetical protein